MSPLFLVLLVLIGISIAAWFLRSGLSDALSSRSGKRDLLHDNSKGRGSRAMHSGEEESHKINVRETNDERKKRIVEEIHVWLNNDPLFLDTETTGIDHFKDEICDIAIIDNYGSVLFESFVKPTIPIPTDASDVHGILNEHVENAPTFDQIWEQLTKVLQGRWVVIYNREYDIALLRNSARAAGILWDDWIRGLPNEKMPTFKCAMLEYSVYHGEKNIKYGGNKWHKLSVAASQQGLTLPDDLHRAKADAELTRQLILKLTEQEFA